MTDEDQIRSAWRRMDLGLARLLFETGQVRMVAKIDPVALRHDEDIPRDTATNAVVFTAEPGVGETELVTRIFGEYRETRIHIANAKRDA